MSLLQKFDLANYKNQMKKAMLLTIAFSTFSIQHTASAEENNDITTIYHVYKDGTLLGSITENDKQKLYQQLSQKIDQTKKTFPKYQLEIDPDVTFIPEQVFHVPEELPQIVDNLANTIQVETNVQALQIDGKETVYLPTEAEMNQLLRKFTLQFVTESELAQYEKEKTQNTNALTAVGTKIKNIELLNEVKIVNSAVLPDKIFTESEALNYLNKGTTELKSYTVQSGDVLSSIAKAYQVSTEELLVINPSLNEDTVLKTGQRIQVKTSKPALQMRVVKEVFKEQDIPFEKRVVESNSLEKGKTKIQQAGQNGVKQLHYEVTQTNGKQTSQNIFSNAVTKEPTEEISIRGTKETSIGSGQLTWPTVGGYVTSEVGTRWGKMHKGIDIAGPSNRAIKAADNGVVVSAGYNNGGYGNKVVIDHGNGMRTIYAHLNSISVKAGQIVSAGSQIGIMGSTGNSTGVHLHFELYVNGQLTNPMSYFN